MEDAMIDHCIVTFNDKAQVLMDSTLRRPSQLFGRSLHAIIGKLHKLLMTCCVTDNCLPLFGYTALDIRM